MAALNDRINTQTLELCDRAMHSSPHGCFDVFNSLKVLDAASVFNHAAGSVKEIAMNEQEFLQAGMEGSIYDLSSRLDVDSYIDEIGEDRIGGDESRRVRRFLCREDGSFGFYVVSALFRPAYEYGRGAFDAAIIFSDLVESAQGFACFVPGSKAFDRAVLIVKSCQEISFSLQSSKEALLNAGIVIPLIYCTELDSLISSVWAEWPDRLLTRQKVSGIHPDCSR